MESLQALQWFFGAETNLKNSCSNMNTFLTIIIYTHLQLQPLIYASLSTKNDNRFAWYMSLCTFVVAMANFIAGFYIKASGLESMSLNEQTNYGLRTCTYEGKDNHLVWKFAIASFQLQPNHFVFMATITITFMLHYDRILQSTICIPFYLTTLISLWSMGGVNAEFSAQWCLIAAFVNIPIVIYTTIHAKNKKKQN
ncbi:unnamed protein product [Adineta steineri]|uniref:Uncharacterized protein n=1 Tax=Adineta steineri TaxID=433720 RepID=A0A815VR39_9BILA|nr:unnamed protein product [Adineta steineri]CAF1535404.1 unnamed protein product [Adineta steineri]